jgi:hypothetical protein
MNEDLAVTTSEHPVDPTETVTDRDEWSAPRADHSTHRRPFAESDVTEPISPMSRATTEIAGQGGVGSDTDLDDDGWLEDEALPARRGRLMTPLTWILLLGLFGVGGFALGTRLEKSHATTAAQAAVQAQIAAARSRGGGFGNGGFGASSGTGTGTGATGASSGTGASNGTGAAQGSGTAAPAATGVIKLVDGDKVYVQNAAGEIIIVTVVSTSAVSRSATVSLADLKAGESVVVQGATNADGTVTATAVVASAASTSPLPSAAPTASAAPATSPAPATSAAPAP